MNFCENKFLLRIAKYKNYELLNENWLLLVKHLFSKKYREFK